MVAPDCTRMTCRKAPSVRVFVKGLGPANYCSTDALELLNEGRVEVARGLRESA